MTQGFSWGAAANTEFCHSEKQIHFQQKFQMTIERLICNSCGAPLDVPTNANFVNCNHCGTQLSINRSKNITFTEQLSRIEETTEALTDQLRELNSHQRLEALDRDWQSRQLSFMMTGKNGKTYAPTKTIAVASSVGAAVFGLLWTAIAIAITASAPSFGPFIVAKFVFPLFGMVFVAVAIFGGIKAYRMSENLEQATRQYNKERESLLQAELDHET